MRSVRVLRIIRTETLLVACRHCNKKKKVVRSVFEIDMSGGRIEQKSCAKTEVEVSLSN